jgi:hypothetical protein
MSIHDETKTLFSGGGTRMRTATRKFSVEIKGDARGSVILQRQVNGVFGQTPIQTDFITMSGGQTKPVGSVIGRMVTGIAELDVDYRVRIGPDFTGSPEFD